MLVIAKNTEARLLDVLHKCKSESPLQRCLYMALSKADVPRKELFETFLRLLHSVPDSYMAEVYICDDHDVFILMQGFMQRKFTALPAQLGEALQTDGLEELAEIFEIGAHWNKLEDLCHTKLDRIEQAQLKEKASTRKEEAERITLEVLESLSPDIVSSISSRREHRDDPVIMVVDDDQIARTLVSNVVIELYESAQAENGKEAIGAYVNRAPDVVFLDIGLPDINGHDLLECFFQLDPDAYVIMFSSLKDKDNIMRALEAGAQGFVGKPFTREKLFHYIEHSPHLIKKQAQRKPYAKAAQSRIE